MCEGLELIHRCVGQAFKLFVFGDVHARSRALRSPLRKSRMERARVTSTIRGRRWCREKQNEAMRFRRIRAALVKAQPATDTAGEEGDEGSEAAQVAEQVIEAAKARLHAADERAALEREVEEKRAAAEEGRRAVRRADEQASESMARAESAAAEVVAAEEALANSRRMSRAVRRAVENTQSGSQMDIDAPTSNAQQQQPSTPDEAGDAASSSAPAHGSSASGGAASQGHESSLDEEDALQWVEERGLSQEEAPWNAQEEVERATKRLEEALAHKTAAEDEAQEIASQAVGFAERAAAVDDELQKAEARLKKARDEEAAHEAGLQSLAAALEGTDIQQELEKTLLERANGLEPSSDGLVMLAVEADELATAAQVALSDFREQQQEARQTLSSSLNEEAVDAAVPEVPEVDEESAFPPKSDAGSEMLKRAAEEPMKRPEAPKSSRHLAGAFFSAGRERDSDLRLGGVGAKVYSNMRWIVAGAGAVGLGLFALFSSSSGMQRVRSTVQSESSAAVTTVTSQFSSLRSPTDAVNAMRRQVGEMSEEAAGTSDVLWLLGSSVLLVPVVSNLPGGSPVLGFLAGGALIGPAGLGIIQNVHGVQHIAEFGVVFLLFNIGLELSYERLLSMAKYVFGLGTLQMLVSTGVIAMLASKIGGLSMPSASIVGVGLAFSSTAVALQVLQDRGESGGRHGRATFSVLLMQDLAVVLVFMLVPLLAPGSSGQPPSGLVIAKAMGNAVVKTGTAIVSIMAAGRIVLRPLYRRIANTNNAEIFAALTLLVVLGTSQLTSALGLSNALGAFLSGLLIAETEFALQVESDIAPYRGLLLGLFFMTVGMEIDFRILAANAGMIFAAMGAFLAIKVGIISMSGPVFGLQPVTSARAAFYLAPGGEFAFVTFGEAVRNNLLPPLLSSQLTIVVALSMAATPWLAMLGSHLREQFGAQDARSLQPVQKEVDDMRDHVIILGYGRVGQLIGQLMSEQLTEFVALDVRPERVAEGRAKDMPVFFGDAGSPAVLKAIGADKAAAAVITLDTPSANYRGVWALKKHFPHVKTYVRAHDVDHGLLLEKAGATAVVPEILEPSLQLASAVLSELNLPADDVATALESFRRKHVQELKRLRSSEGHPSSGSSSQLPASQQPATSSSQSHAAPSSTSTALDDSTGNGRGPSPKPAQRSKRTDLSAVPEEALLQPAISSSDSRSNAEGASPSS